VGLFFVARFHALSSHIATISPHCGRLLPPCDISPKLDFGKKSFPSFFFCSEIADLPAPRSSFAKVLQYQGSIPFQIFDHFPHSFFHQFLKIKARHPPCFDPAGQR